MALASTASFISVHLKAEVNYSQMYPTTMKLVVRDVRQYRGIESCRLHRTAATA